MQTFQVFILLVGAVEPPQAGCQAVVSPVWAVVPPSGREPGGDTVESRILMMKSIVICYLIYVLR